MTGFPKRTWDLYKLILSFVFGMMGFIGSFYAVRFQAGNSNINIVWSLAFPMLIALVWGRMYACISILSGLVFLYPFFLGSYNGWASIVPSLCLFMWAMIHGYGAEARNKKPMFYYNIYFLQLIYIVLRFLLYVSIMPYLYRLNPPFWNPKAYTFLSFDTIMIFAVKGVIVETIIIALCDVILLSPMVKRIFRLPYNPSERYNTRIILSMLGLGLLFTLITFTNTHYIIKGEHSFSWLLNLDTDFMMSAALQGLFFSIAGGIVARFFQKRLEFQESLKVSEEKYRDIFDRLEDLYVETTFEGKILTISPSVKEILGYEVEELLGTNLEAIYYEPMHRDHYIKNLLEQRELKNYELVFRAKSGHAHYFWVHSRIVEDHKGQKYIVGMGRDVTQYIEVKRRESEIDKKYKLVLQRMLNGFVVFEPVYQEGQLADLCFVDVNAGFERHFHVMAAEVLGRTWIDIFGFKNENLERYRQVIASGEAVNVESYISSIDQYFFGNIFKISENRIGVIFEDITPIKNALLEVNKLNQELERRVKERTIELQHVVDELEAFTYTVSHDLKSPLRSIEGYCDFIKEDYGDTMNKDALKMLDNIHSIGSGMITLINKLLSYSIASKREISQETVDIQALFEASFYEKKLECKKQTTEMRIEKELPKVIGDKLLLNQVINNILSNAFKFTRERDKGVITVSCDLIHNEYVFSVKDNGVGFDMSYSGKLFGIFQRLHTVEEFEGSGVGLAIIKKIIQKHGGRVWMEGKQNEGATIYFTLPAGGPYGG